jgi:hypothetical protein
MYSKDKTTAAHALATAAVAGLRTQDEYDSDNDKHFAHQACTFAVDTVTRMVGPRLPPGLRRTLVPCLHLYHALYLQTQNHLGRELLKPLFLKLGKSLPNLILLITCTILPTCPLFHCLK